MKKKAELLEYFILESLADAVLFGKIIFMNESLTLNSLEQCPF
jgi:hypothetical protein